MILDPGKTCCRLAPFYTFNRFFFLFYATLAIRDWVLIPIMIVMVLVGILRHHITMLITGTPKTPQPKAIRES